MTWVLVLRYLGGVPLLEGVSWGRSRQLSGVRLLKRVKWATGSKGSSVAVAVAWERISSLLATTIITFAPLALARLIVVLTWSTLSLVLLSLGMFFVFLDESIEGSIAAWTSNELSQRRVESFLGVKKLVVLGIIRSLC